MNIFVPILFAVGMVLTLGLAPTVLDTAASPNGAYVCFLGVNNFHDLVPILYYGAVAVLGIGALGTAAMSIRGGQMSMRTLSVGLIAGLSLVGVFVGGLDGNRAYAQSASSCLLRDGSLTMTGNLDMDSNDILDLGNISAHTLAGDITGNSQNITGLENLGSVNATTTTLTATGGGSLTGTWSDLGTVTTVDINGGTIDGAVIGGSSAAAGSFTTGTFSGNVGIADTSPSTALSFGVASTISTDAGDLTLDPAGNVSVEGHLAIDATSRLYLDGSAATGDTYIHEQAADVMEFFTDGSKRLGLDSSGLDVGGGKIISLGGGSDALPAIAFSGDGDTGVYRVGANNLGLAAGGVGILTMTATVATLTGNLVPEADGTRDLGIQTTAQWANVWADLVNGADIAMANGWRMIEAELYEGYPTGWAIGHGDWEDGVAVWNHPEMVANDTPVFAVTDEFIEFQGVRIDFEMWDKLAALLDAFEEEN